MRDNVQAKPDRFLEIARSLRPSLFGFSLLVSLEQYVHFQWDYPSAAVSISFFGVQIIVLALLAVLQGFGRFPEKAAFALAGIASLAVAVILVYNVTETPLSVPLAVAGGAAFACLYVPWFKSFSHLDTVHAVIAFFGAQLIAGVFGALVCFSPATVKAVIYAVCALASVACGIDTARHAPACEQPASFYADGDHREPVQYGALIVLFGLSAGYFNQSDLAASVLGVDGYFALWSAGSAVLAAILLALLDKGRFEPRLNTMWRVFVATILACFLATQAFESVGVLEVAVCGVVSALRTAIVSFFCVAMIDIARYSRKDPFVVLCAGYAISIAAFTIPDVLSYITSTPLYELSEFWMVVFLVVAASLFIFRENDFSQARVFAELCTPVSTRAEYETLEQKCKVAAEQYSLSAREEEVLRLLSAGRTRSYIAETLFISESTVATHSKRIYQKMDVHSKQELIDLITQLS